MLSYFLDSFCSLIDSFNIYVGYIIFFISSIIFVVLCVWLHNMGSQIGGLDVVFQIYYAYYFYYYSLYNCRFYFSQEVLIWERRNLNFLMFL